MSSSRQFHKRLQRLLEAHPEAALEHAKLFAELPLPTQLAIMRSKLTDREQAIERALLRGEYIDVAKSEFDQVAQAIVHRRKTKRR